VLGQVHQGDRVCARLERSGDEWSARYVDPGTPSGTTICGRAQDDASPGESVQIEYGIETYFANEERAHAIESAIAGGQLYVVVDLDEDGSARIEKLDGG
jgi:uncharacterized membrane-anchored protein